MPVGERRRRQIRVPVTEAEGARIEQKAAEVGLGLAEFLRRLGMEHSPKSLVDQTKVDTLHKAMADLGRLGGLLKLWLTDDTKLEAYPEARLRRVIPDAVQQIRRNQSMLLELIKDLKADVGQRGRKKEGHEQLHQARHVPD